MASINYQPPSVDFFGKLSAIGDTIVNRRKDAERKALYSGAVGPDGAVDFSRIMAGALRAGDPQAALLADRLMQDRRDFRFRQDESKRQQGNADRQFQLAQQRVPTDLERRATAAGLVPGQQEYKDFMLRGGRNADAPLSATDKKAILEAEEGVLNNQNVIRALDEAKKISPQAHTGFGASTRAWLGNALPDLMVPDAIASKESSAATANYDNLVMGQALTQLKSIFGAAPTEGERKILLEIQASADKPNAVRQDILTRASAMAQRRLEFNQRRVDELRGGTYYKPGGGTSAPQAQPMQGARQAPDGNYYVPDPNRPGKYLMVRP